MARAIWMTLSVGVGLALSGCGAADMSRSLREGERRLAIDPFEIFRVAGGHRQR